MVCEHNTFLNLILGEHNDTLSPPFQRHCPFFIIETQIDSFSGLSIAVFQAHTF